jgi:hypothetical protein
MTAFWPRVTAGSALSGSTDDIGIDGRRRGGYVMSGRGRKYSCMGRPVTNYTPSSNIHHLQIRHHRGVRGQTAARGRAVVIDPRAGEPDFPRPGS